MKKLTACLLLCFFLLSLVGCGEEEEPQTYSQGLAFETLTATTCQVSGRGTCTDEKVVIPEISPEGRTVVAVGGYAFQNDATLTAVSLPIDLKEIGAYAFAGCTGLTYFQFPDKLERVGMYAFSRCTGITSIFLGSALQEVGDGAFSGCGAMTYAFFRGDGTAWGGVQVGNGNSALTMTLYLYSASRPTGSGRYWYYQNGSFKLW